MTGLMILSNGSPFATMGAGGLSRLSVWWLSQGIDVEYTRKHRTLRAECCHPPSVHGAAQQRRFARFRERFNRERSHEASGQRVLADLYQASQRRYEADTSVDLYEPNTATLLVNESNGYATAKARGAN